MKEMRIEQSDVIAILSAFEKLVFPGQYTLTAGDAKLIRKTMKLLDDRQQTVMKAGYPLLFEALNKTHPQKIVCVAGFRLGASSYTEEFIADTEGEITDLINEEVEKRNSEYLWSRNT